MNKKIEYNLKIVYKYSMLDMAFNFRIIGHIIYKKQKYSINALKSYDNPKFKFSYYENVNKSMIDLLDNISSKLIRIVDIDLRNFPNNAGEYDGTIDWEE